jgi:hypothetical protein
MKRLITTAAMIAVIMGGLIASQTPASADRATIKHGRDYATTSADHSTIKVCDQEKDGHAVVAWILMDNNGYESVEDIDGSSGGCTSYTLPSPAHGVAVCEEAVGCTRYYLA